MRHEALALFEQGLKVRYGVDAIIGIDEAGRGALAGPVYAAACIITDPRSTGFINDSKLLSERQRQQAYTLMPSHAVFATGVASVAEIDRENILRATWLAMERAYRQLVPLLADRGWTLARLGVVVDGPSLPPFLCESGVPTALALIDADAVILAVAGASIAAKVERDRCMRDLSRRIHGYGLDHNVGYGTREHIAALRARGPSSEHRRTFVVKALLPPDEELPLGTSS